MTGLRASRPEDAPALADLLFRSPQAGRMVLGQQRPDVFARRLPYDEAVTFVADGESGIVATGTAATKTVLVDGAPATAAYVFDVAVDEAARGRGLAKRVLGAIEGWASDRDAAFLYAHVLRGNEASVGTFRSSGYRVEADLASRAYPAFGEREGPPSGARAIEDWDAAARVLAEGLAGYDLVRPLDGAGLRGLWTSLPGWRPEDVWTTGRAVLGLWDYSSVTRSVPLRLPPEVKALDALGRLARRLRVPFPRAPRLGEPMSFGLLLGGTGEDRGLRRLLRAALGRTRERSLDTLVFFHDKRVRPPWTRAAFSVADVYHLVAKPLGGPVPGTRPVWVDPVDL